MSNRKYEYKWKTIKVGEGFQTTKINSSNDFYNYIQETFDNLDAFREHFVITALDRANNTIGTKIISSGGINGTVVDIRITAKYLIEMLASGCIFSHNHPSGNLNPSIADDNITTQSRDALKLLDIKLLDHLIIDEFRYYSYADNSRL